MTVKKIVTEQKINDNLEVVFIDFEISDLFFEIYTNNFNRRLTYVEGVEGKYNIYFDSKEDQEVLTKTRDGIFYIDNKGREKSLTTYGDIWENIKGLIVDEHFEKKLVEGVYKVDEIKGHLGYRVDKERSYIGTYGTYRRGFSALEEYSGIGLVEE